MVSSSVVIEKARLANYYEFEEIICTKLLATRDANRGEHLDANPP